jgi:CHAT domain-containing protein/tetratricopeptide (TPR) repeat protein
MAVAIALVASPVHAQPAGPPAASRVGPASTSIVDAATSLDLAFDQLERFEFAAAEKALTALLARSDLAVRARARALRGLGASLYEQHRRQEAAGAFDRALEAAEAAGDRSERGWARLWIGTLRYGEGHADQASSLWNAARDDFVASGNWVGEFEVVDNLGHLVQSLDLRPLAERCYRIAIEHRAPLLEARARRRWGRALLDAALPGPALVELERAVALMRSLGPPARRYLADALSTLGWALRTHGAHVRAAAVHREAIRMALASGDVNALIWNNLGLGSALGQLHRYGEADVAMRRGLDAARRTGSATSIRRLTEAVGWVSLMRGDDARAAETLERALAMPGVDVSVLPLIHLSRAYRRLGRLDDALTAATRGLELTRKRGLVDNELRVLVELAQVQEARAELDAAQLTLRDVVDRLERYRAELAPHDFLKQGFGDRFSDAYGASVHLLMRRERPAEALTAAERLRSRAFGDLLATRRLREIEEAETASGVWMLGGAPAPTATPGVRSDSAHVLPALDSAGLAALARRLSTTLVVYWIHDRGSYAWVVRDDGAIHAVALQTTPAALRRAVRNAADAEPEAAIRRSSASRATAIVGTRAAYRTLHQLLWSPLARWLPQDADARITIIPHGPLFALPFGALLDRQGRYVVERYALHYTASGAVLAEAADASRRQVASDARRLLVADPQPLPAVRGRARLPALTAARNEVLAIASMDAGADQLVGVRASEAAVRAALPGARLAHFATHAIVSGDDPLGSYLMLGTGTAGGATRDNDGRLTASEVAGLSLAADLVVLGACRSGRGPVSSDGIAGLTRAFMTAGAPSLVATLWDVSDRTTARVMTQFYAGYLSGVSKDRALRAAQLALLRDLRAGKVRRRVGETTITYAEHPHLWAGTLLIGAP